jgi:multisubunit Na+/H+ antiporter MnhG subunit
MNLDIRLPIGIMFGMFGVLLAGFGFFSNPQIYERSLGTNINLEWGIVLIVFGAIMLAFGLRGSRKAARTGSAAGR